MSLWVMAAVLCGALLHALWNLLAKHNAGRAGNAVVVGIMAGLPAALTLPFSALPDSAAWPQVIASALIHVVYFKVLAGAYRGGDLSVAYPLMRGLPPLAVAMAALCNIIQLLSLVLIEKVLGFRGP